jgi:hypothetical protein
MEDTLSKAFGMEENHEYLDAMSNKSNLPAKKQEEPEKSDYEFVRENIKELITKSTMALDDLLDLAKQSEHPRTYEVLTQLLKTVSEQNKDLIDIETKVKGKKKEEEGTTKIQNALFVGSTAELLKGLKEKNDG